MRQNSILYPMWLMAFCWSVWNHWQQFEGTCHLFDTPSRNTWGFLVGFWLVGWFLGGLFVSLFLWSGNHYGKPFILFLLCSSTTTFQLCATYQCHNYHNWVGEKPIKVFGLLKWQLETKTVVIKWNCAGVFVVTWHRTSSFSQTVLETPVLSCTGELTKDSGQENWLRQEAFLLTNLPLC